MIEHTENLQPLFADVDNDGNISLTWATKDWRFWLMIPSSGRARDGAWGIVTNLGINEFGALSEDAAELLCGKTKFEELE